MSALEDLEKLNLTSEIRSDIQGLKTYVESFQCILMASIWVKVLTAIDYRNKVLQARSATLDVEVDNIQSLIEDLKQLREQWDAILDESKLVVENIGIEPVLPECRQRKRKRFADEACMSVQDDRNCSQKDHFRNNVFYVILDCVIGNMTNRYDSIHALESMFGFLWKYLNMNDSEVEEKVKFFVSQYAGDVSSELVQEILHLKAIHTSNLGEKPLNPIYLLNKLAETSLMGLFPNCCVALRIYCTLPVTVAQAERSFSVLIRIKNYLRSTMCQMRLTSLGTLAVESELAKQVNYDVLIESFANKKARKAAVGTAFKL